MRKAMICPMGIQTSFCFHSILLLIACLALILKLAQACIVSSIFKCIQPKLMVMVICSSTLQLFAIFTRLQQQTSTIMKVPICISILGLQALLREQTILLNSVATDVTLMNYDFVSFRAQRLLISSSSMALVGTREYNWISFN